MKKIVIKAQGHSNVSAKHKTTVEITKEDFLTPTGDCIVAINADKGLGDLDKEFKELLKQGKKLKIELACGGVRDTITAYGDPRLTFTNPTSMVIRKSGFVCGRTLCVRADKAAADLDGRLIGELRKGGPLKVTLRILQAVRMSRPSKPHCGPSD